MNAAGPARPHAARRRDALVPTRGILALASGRMRRCDTLLDRLLGWIADIAAFGWFRSVEVAGRDRFPREGPVVVVANHGGGFVDPALLASVLPRLPRFLATASLWKYVITRPLLAFAGAIPVYRAVDGPTDHNRGTFDRCHEVLREGGVVALFPEGRASDATHLLAGEDGGGPDRARRAGGGGERRRHRPGRADVRGQGLGTLAGVRARGPPAHARRRDRRVPPAGLGGRRGRP